MAMVLIAIGICLFRRIRVSKSAAFFALLGIICLALAAGSPVWNRRQPRSVAVMVDLSPSTRGASFRDVAFLSRRIHELLGDAPFQLFGFGAQTQPLALDAPLTEMPADSTVYSPPPADVVLLFSDARFEVPVSSSPTFVVVDPELENVTDAAIDRLELNNGNLTATINDAGGPRIATFHGVTGNTTQPVSTGRIVVSRPIENASSSATVELNPGDLWPENDAMSLPVAPPYASQSWWISDSAPALPGWKWIAPDQAPAEPTQYLSCAVIVLHNVSPAQLGDAAMDRLTQYSRDLGGSILIVGTDQSFAPGGYIGTPLETMSPLSSAPPEPTTRWLLVADASGSMADDAGGISRFGAATDAIARLLPQLPPKDRVAVGQFSDDLRWWTTDQSAEETAKLRLPPADAAPHGPTNLESALNRIAADADAAMPTELLILSDCDTRIDKPSELIDLMQRKKIRLNVVALAHGSGIGAIQNIAQATGGQVVEQVDPKQWLQSIRKLAQAALPPRLMQTSANVQFENEAKAIGAANPTSWDRAWLKQDAQRWAQTTDQSPPAPIAAFWKFGKGSVAAAAFVPSDSQIEMLAKLIAQRPRDPRYSVRWETSPQLHVTIDALDQGKYLNDLDFKLETAPTGGNTVAENRAAVPQVGPGRYALAIPAPRRPGIVTLIGPGGQVVDRISVAGRYAPEFDAVGNDHQNMQRLAETSGGALVLPGNHHAINFPWPRQEVSLASWLCALGAALILAALVKSRADV
jgi:hypothetical protein